MCAVEIVVMQPGLEVVFSICGVVVGAGVGPFAQGGLDEAFGLAVGGWGIGLGEAVFDVLLAHGLAEDPVPVAGAVVGEHAADGEAEACVVSAAEMGNLLSLYPKIHCLDADAKEPGSVLDGHGQFCMRGVYQLTSV